MSTLPKQGRTWHPQSSNQPVMGSFAVFLFGTTTVTGNLSGTDVERAPQFPITRFVETTGGITNCVEPASKSQLKDLK